MQIKIKLIPQNFIDKYNLMIKVKMSTLIVKLFTEYTDYPKQANLPTISSKTTPTRKGLY